MTTSTEYVYWNYYASGTDSDIRAMMTTFYSKLESVGWTQSADTGQVNETTVTNAAVTASTTTTVYQIHYFDDDLHATTPIYLKTRWIKTGYTNGYIAINFELGTGTNGSGTLTGATYAISSSSSATVGAATSNYIRLDTTYAANKYSGLFIGGTEALSGPAAQFGGCSFFFARSVDVVTEEPTSDGAVFYTTLVGNAPSYVRMHYYNGTAWAYTDNYSFVPGNKSYSPPEGFAVYRHWFVAQNKYQLVPHMVTVMHNEMGLDQELTVTPGSLPHTYRKLGLTWPCSTYQGSSPASSKHRPAVIWE